MLQDLVVTVALPLALLYLTYSAWNRAQNKNNNNSNAHHKNSIGKMDNEDKVSITSSGAEDDDDDVLDSHQANANDDDESTQNNKLKHNIKKKGQNSYYYAHAKKADAPVVREAPPQLVEKAKEVHTAKPKARKYEKFAWADGKKIVSVYIDQTEADKIGDDNVNLVWEKNFFEIRVDDGNALGPVSLRIDKLYAEIQGAAIKKKTDKFVVTLTKIEEKSWFRLQQ